MELREAFVSRKNRFRLLERGMELAGFAPGSRLLPHGRGYRRLSDRKSLPARAGLHVFLRGREGAALFGRGV